MASIMTSIGLQDNFTGVVYGMINAINLTIAAMGDMRQSISADMDTASLEGARYEIDRATMAAGQLSNALEKAGSFSVDVAKLSGPVSVPVNPVNLSGPVSVPVNPAVSALPAIQEPMRLPVELQTSAGNGINSSGMADFEQEMQRLNQQLDSIRGKQEEIAAQSASTSVLAPEVLQETDQVAESIRKVEEQMAALEKQQLDIGAGNANAQLARMKGQIQQAVQAQQGLNRAVRGMNVSGASAAYRQLSGTVAQTQEQIRQNTQEQERFNDTVRQGNANAGTLMQTIKRTVAAYVSLQGVMSALRLSDSLSSSQAKLNIMMDAMNEKTMTNGQLQNMIFASAERSRGSYLDTLNTVAKLGNLAKDAFRSPKEVVAFAEQLNKQFVIAGASTSEMQNATLQLTQGLASGVLRGDELNSIFEQAPTIIQAIAGYLDVPMGQIREMASRGEITAEIVKNAMFAAADETNAKFESMPKTFEQIGQSIKNNAIQAFEPVLTRMNEIANSQGFEEMVQGLIQSMAVLARVVLEVFNVAAAVGGFIADNWSIIGPIVLGIVAVFALYNAALLVNNAIQRISNLQKRIAVVQSAAHGAAIAKETLETLGMSAAQLAFNAALYACPLTWIIIAIIGLIAVIMAVVGAINRFGDTSVSVTGVVCGVFSVAGTFIKNVVFALINLVIDRFAALWNFVASFANFFANVFTDPIGAVARLFFDFVDGSLAMLQSLASVIDTIFGSSLADSVAGWRSSLDEWVTGKFGEEKVIMEKVNPEDYHLQRSAYSDAWEKGYATGEQFTGNRSAADAAGSYGAFDYSEFLTDVDSISGNTGDIKDGMDRTQEDLKYLRDIAEQETVNRFTTAAITIEQTNHNNVSGGLDLDGVITGLTDAVGEAAEILTEGVHS